VGEKVGGKEYLQISKIVLILAEIRGEVFNFP